MNRADIFLACYRKTGSITKAAAAAKIDRAIHYRRLGKDPVYAAAFAEAEKEAKAFLTQQAEDRIVEAEDALFTRAVEGWDEPVTYQGGFTYEPVRDEEGKVVMAPDPDTGDPKPVMSDKPVCIRKFSDSNLQFFLRGARPEKYRERHQVEHTGTVTIVERLQAGRKRAAQKKNDPESGDD